MKFEKITVSGIAIVVIDRKARWMKNSEDGVWCKANSFDNAKPHADMMAIVNHLKADKRYRMWLHGNTLNIVKV
jgi:hypothetical protein